MLNSPLSSASKDETNVQRYAMHVTSCKVSDMATGKYTFFLVAVIKATDLKAKPGHGMSYYLSDVLLHK